MHAGKSAGVLWKLITDFEELRGLINTSSFPTCAQKHWACRFSLLILYQRLTVSQARITDLQASSITGSWAWILILTSVIWVPGIDPFRQGKLSPEDTQSSRRKWPLTLGFVPVRFSESQSEPPQNLARWTAHVTCPAGPISLKTFHGCRIVLN